MASSLRVGGSPGRGATGARGADSAEFARALQGAKQVETGDGLLVLVQRRGMRGGAGPLRMPGGGMAEVSPVEELRVFRFDRALRTIQRYEPNNREATFMAAPNQPPSEEWTRKLENEAAAVLLRQANPPQPARPAAPGSGMAPGGNPAMPGVQPPAAALGATPLQFLDWDAVSNRAGVSADGTAYATLKGATYDLTGWTTETFLYAKSDRAVTEALRDRFSNFVRADFCEYLALNHKAELEAAGLRPEDIARLNNGNTPDNYEVHHKRPLDAGGTNSFDNLILVRLDPDHKVLTNFQNTVGRGLQPGQTRQVQWPVPPPGMLVWPNRPHQGFQAR